MKMRLFKRKAVVPNKTSGLSPKLIILLNEAGWLLMVVFTLYLILILASHSPNDAAWSHHSTSPTVENYGGMFGAWAADILLFTFGLSAWWWVLLSTVALLWAYRRLQTQIEINKVSNTADKPFLPTQTRHLFFALSGFSLFIAASAGLERLLLIHPLASVPLAGGALGDMVSRASYSMFGLAGALLLLLTLAAIGFSLLTGLSWLNLIERIGLWLEDAFSALYQSLQTWRDRKMGRKEAQRRDEKISHEKKKNEEQQALRIEPPPIEPASPLTKPVKAIQASLFAEAGENTLPSLTLLHPVSEQRETVSTETVEYTSRLIEHKLADFGVTVKVVAAYPGPVITRYEIEPAIGVKGAQIVNLMKDLARALSLISIRVVETIPGKTYMGLELPNPKRQIVHLSEIIGSHTYQTMRSPLALALGKDIAGQAVCADLAKMPHLLVAGTTGSGKSVAINAMILSLLYKATPREVRLIMVDPKMLELSIYEGIPHLLAPVVTDMKQAAHALNWCIAEMERRYRLMSALGVRNLAGYNQKIDGAQKNDQPIIHPFSLNPETPELLDHLATIVVIIDELADLMMVAGKKIEELIARLAQKARAAGIHLILATQRPSVDVITGLIKANIPTRIAFQVSSKIDSRTILDQMGAEALLGQGDMLYLPPGTGHPQRGHGAFVADEEVHAVVEFLKTRGAPDYIDSILAGATHGEDSEISLTSDADTIDDAEQDPLYDEAVNMVIKSRRASISSVQRQLRIGYNRAARLIEQMEAAGVVSAMQNNGNRTVLHSSSTDD